MLGRKFEAKPWKISLFSFLPCKLQRTHFFFFRFPLFSRATSVFRSAAHHSLNLPSALGAETALPKKPFLPLLPPFQLSVLQRLSLPTRELWQKCLHRQPKTAFFFLLAESQFLALFRLLFPRGSSFFSERGSLKLVPDWLLRRGKRSGVTRVINENRQIKKDQLFPW